MNYLAMLEIVNKLLTIVGDLSLSEAKTWLEVKANAEDLKAEGHEGEPPADTEGFDG